MGAISSTTDLTGRWFGEQLEVLGPLKARGSCRERLWRVRCHGCGRVVEWNSTKLQRNKSCGCLRAAAIGAAHRKYDGPGSSAPEYRVWIHMLRRCHDPDAAKFPDYGGRGIAVCAAWRRSYAAFLADVGSRPSPQHQIEREDNDGHYEPGNVRWATRKEQARNKRCTVYLEYAGQRASLPEWAERSKLDLELLRGRLKAGWTTERALTTPVRARLRSAVGRS